MSDSVRFKYTLTEDDYVRASWIYLYYSRGWRIILLLFGSIFVLVAALAIVATIKHGRLTFGGLPYLGLIPLLLALFAFRLRWHFRATARKSPFVGIEYEMTFSPDGITSRSSHGNSDTRWSVLTGARESDKYFLLHAGMHLYYPYPKRVFATADDLARFRELIRENVPGAKLQHQPASE